MINIGIDPGVNSGCVAIRNNKLDDQWILKRFDQTPYFEIDKLFKSIKAYADNNNETICCVIERQNPMPKQGISSTGKQMKHYGTMLGLLLANGISYEDPVPRTWMKLYGMTKTSSETKTQWKNRLKQKAKELEPKLSIINHNADAILIARVAHKFFE